MPRTRSGSRRRGTARLLPELGAVEMRELPAARDQLRERALLDDTAVVEDQDHVRPPDRREPVRDDEGRAPGEEPLEPPHDERLGGGVERRRLADRAFETARVLPRARAGDLSDAGAVASRGRTGE